jgi:hypothetical protein
MVPPNFSGHGNATIIGNELDYEDDKGHQLTFVPGDGRTPPCA